MCPLFRRFTVVLPVSATLQDVIQFRSGIQWSSSITDTTGTKNFVLNSEVSFVQGVIVYHTPLAIVASYAGASLRTMIPVVLMIDLLIFNKNQGHIWDIATVGR